MKLNSLFYKKKYKMENKVYDRNFLKKRINFYYFLIYQT